MGVYETERFTTECTRILRSGIDDAEAGPFTFIECLEVHTVVAQVAYVKVCGNGLRFKGESR